METTRKFEDLKDKDITKKQSRTNQGAFGQDLGFQNQKSTSAVALSEMETGREVILARIRFIIGFAQEHTAKFSNK